MFGLVLAVGLVVDDAIVVVEGVQRTSRRALLPRTQPESHARTLRPVIGIALVLSAVFVPTAFIPGITGRLYQQFAVTIAISVLLSAFNALTLSPRSLLCCFDPRNRAEDCSTDFSIEFNRVFGRATDGYSI